MKNQRVFIIVLAVAGCTGDSAAPPRLPTASSAAAATPAPASISVQNAPPLGGPRHVPLELTLATHFSSGNWLSPEGLALDPAGNIVLCGSLKGDMKWGETSLATRIPSGEGPRHAFVGKLDPRGVPLWAKIATVSNLIDHGAPAVAVGKDGAVVFTAEFDVKTSIDDKNLAALNPAEGYANVLVASLNGQGALHFARGFGGINDNDTPAGVAVNAEGEVVVVGDFSTSTRFDNIVLTPKPHESTMFVAKLDRDGKVLWANGFGGKSRVVTKTVAIDSTGNIHVGGEFDGTLTTGAATLEASSYRTGFLLALAPNGTTLWARAFGGPERSSVRAVAAANGTLAVAVEFRPPLMTPLPLAAANGNNIAIFKLDPQGQAVWVRPFGGPNTEVGTVAVAPDGMIAFCGSSRVSFDFAGMAVENRSGSGAFVAAFSTEGVPLGARGFGGTGIAECTGLAIRPSGAIVATGFYSGTIDLGSVRLSTSGSAHRDTFLVELQP